MAQDTSNQIERTATVLKVLFHNKDNNYAILKCENAESKAKLPGGFVVKGAFPDAPVPGNSYRMIGYAERDPQRREWYFKVKEAHHTGNRTAEGWVEYLTREGPHIGDIRAEELYEKFGDAVIDKMAESVDNLLGMRGITRERADELHVWAKQEKYLANIKQWLYRHGLKPAMISKIIIVHGNKTAQVVQKDTFLLTEIKGIGFKTADFIAQKVGLPATDKRRIETGVVFALKELLEDGGHTCVFHDRLTRAAQELLSVDKELIYEAYKSLVASGKLCTQRSDILEVSKRPHLFEPTAA